MRLHTCQKWHRMIMVTKCLKSQFAAHYRVNYWVFVKGAVIVGKSERFQTLHGSLIICFHVVVPILLQLLRCAHNKCQTNFSHGKITYRVMQRHKQWMTTKIVWYAVLQKPISTEIWLKFSWHHQVSEMEDNLIVAVCGHPALYHSLVLYRNMKERVWIKVSRAIGLHG